jgi:hypothetical protein
MTEYIEKGGAEKRSDERNRKKVFRDFRGNFDQPAPRVAEKTRPSS